MAKQKNETPEVSTQNQTPNVPAPAPEVPAKSPEMPKYKVLKRVTLPTVNPGTNRPVIYRIEDAFRTSDYIDPNPAKANEKPATICTITDMQTGAVCTWLVAEVCYKNLVKMYPENSYVGRVFGIQKLPKRPGKRYFDFEIAELALEE